MKKKLLVIESHSDDSAIGAQGMIRRLIQRDHEAYFVVIAVGDTRFNHCGVVTSDRRLEEYGNYMKRLGGIWIREEFPLLEEARLDRYEMRLLVAGIEKIIHSLNPDILICQAPSFHQDHTATYEATIAAIRPTVRQCPREILLMENPTYVHSLGPSTDFRPTTYCELTEEEMEEKIRCFVECFPTQVRGPGNCLSPEGIRALARYRGFECRAEQYAEAFMTFMRRV